MKHTVDKNHLDNSTPRSLWLATYRLRKYWKRTSGKDWKPAATQDFIIDDVVVRGDGEEGIKSRKLNQSKVITRYRNKYGSIESVRIIDFTITKYLGEANKNA